MSWNDTLQNRPTSKDASLVFGFGFNTLVTTPQHGFTDGFCSLIDPTLLKTASGNYLGGNSGQMSGGVISSAHPLRVPRAAFSVHSLNYYISYSTTGVIPTVGVRGAGVMLWISALSHDDLVQAWNLRSPLTTTYGTQIIDKPYGSGSDVASGHTGTLYSWFNAMQQLDPSSKVLHFVQSNSTVEPTQFFPVASRAVGTTFNVCSLYREYGYVNSVAPSLIVTHDMDEYTEAVARGMPNVPLTAPLGHYVHAAFSGLTATAEEWTAFAISGISVYSTLSVQASPQQLPGS